MINKWLYLILCVIIFITPTTVFAGDFSYRGEIGVSAGGVASFIEIDNEDSESRVTNTLLQFTLRGRLEAEYELNKDLSAFLVLDPSVSTDGTSEELTTDKGLTELYALYRLGEVDITAGLERLPLETARLNVPFSIATKEEQNPGNDPKGFFKGIWGARAAWYPGDYRLRSAIYYKNERLNSVVSIRRNFGEFELEVHGVYSENFSFGLSGSGLIGDIVVYGESWLLVNAPQANNPTEDETTVRAALGATSYWGDALWTIEGAYIPAAIPIPIPGIIPSEPFPQLAGQMQIPFGEDQLNSITLTSRLGLPDEGIVGAVGFDLNFPEDDVSTRVSFNNYFTDKAMIISLSLDVTGFF